MCNALGASDLLGKQEYVCGCEQGFCSVTPSPHFTASPHITWEAPFQAACSDSFFFFKKKKSFFVYFLLVVLVFAFVGETMDSSCTKERDVLGVIAQIIGQQGTWSLDVPAIRWKKLSAKPFAGTTVVQTGCWMLLETGVRNLESGSSFCTWDSCREAWRSCWRGWEHPLADSEPKSGMEAAGCLQRFLLGEYPDQTAPLDFPGARSSSHW